MAPIFFVVALLMLPLDLSVAKFCLRPPSESYFPGDIKRLIGFAEVYGHSFGIAMIGVTLLVLMAKGRRRVLRVLSCAYLSGLTVDLIKLVVNRDRPYTFRYNELPESVWQTFGDFLPTEPFNADVHSFPSGHSANAVGLAIGLAWLLPRGRWLFAFFAFFAMFQRVSANAHFLSDTFASAAVACLVAGACLDDRLLGRWFNRFEKEP